MHEVQHIYEIRKWKPKTEITPTVTAADGGNLEAIGITTCKIGLGTEMIKQDFIVCTYLKQNLILGIHFTCLNCAGIEWTKEGTRILTLKAKNIIEITEVELGIPVTACKNVTSHQELEVSFM